MNVKTGKYMHDEKQASYIILDISPKEIYCLKKEKY